MEGLGSGPPSGLASGVEGDGITHVIVRVDGEQDGTNIGLKLERL